MIHWLQVFLPRQYPDLQKTAHLALMLVFLEMRHHTASAIGLHMASLHSIGHVGTGLSILGSLQCRITMRELPRQYVRKDIRIAMWCAGMGAQKAAGRCLR